MKIIFTDIDGVLNPHFKKVWCKKATKLYCRLCHEYGLKPVITSTWRIGHDKTKLQEIFKQNGIDIEIYDYTPVLNDDRGLEIKQWLEQNEVEDYIVLDDRIYDIVNHIDNDKIIKCRSWIGFSLDEYNEIKQKI